MPVPTTMILPARRARRCSPDEKGAAEWWANSPSQTSRSRDGWLRLFFEPRDDLDMGRVAELIDRGHRREPIAAIDQKAHVAGERCRIARHRDDDRDIARRERA